MAVRIRTPKEKNIPAPLRLLKYLLLTALVVGFVFYFSGYVPEIKDKSGMFLIVVLFATIGAFIGDTVRRYCKPDIVYAKNDLETILRTKLYWKYGPQWSGWCIGLVLAVWLCSRG